MPGGRSTGALGPQGPLLPAPPGDFGEISGTKTETAAAPGRRGIAKKNVESSCLENVTETSWERVGGGIKSN